VLNNASVFQKDGNLPLTEVRHWLPAAPWRNSLFWANHGLHTLWWVTSHTREQNRL